MLRQAQHERIWGIHPLVPHPDTPPAMIQAVGVQILSVDDDAISLEYSVRGRANLRIGAEAPAVRTDGLWRTTCFEAFLKPVGSTTYFEMNFAPTFAWAAYRFESYREGMAPIEPRLDPEIMISVPDSEADHFFLFAEFDIGHFLTNPCMLGLSAVIEETDGTKSYWALAHPPGAPDFHHPDCFALELPAILAA